jgi:RimJ/RimL family protein N-acetyltransferase
LPVRRALKKALTVSLGQYRFNRIYRSTSGHSAPVTPPGIRCERLEGTLPTSVADPQLRERFWYGGDDANGYGLFLEDNLGAACWFWGPRRFNDPLLWTLREGEAMLMDVMTATSCRGQGFAPLLIRYASADMWRIGCNLLYAFIWHNHHASCHAFEKAGWRQVAWVLQIQPFGISRVLRFCWSTRLNRGHSDG